MSEETPKIEEAREIIKVRRIRANPNVSEKKNEEADAAKARQGNLKSDCDACNSFWPSPLRRSFSWDYAF